MGLDDWVTLMLVWLWLYVLGSFINEKVRGR